MVSTTLRSCLSGERGPRLQMQQGVSGRAAGTRKHVLGQGACDLRLDQRLTVPSQVLICFCFLSASVNQRVVTHLVSVKNCTPSLPSTCRSPKKESLWPEKGKKDTDTGMPTLMPTM